MPTIRAVPTTTTVEANIRSVSYNNQNGLTFTIDFTVTSPLGTAQLALGTTLDDSLLVDLPIGDYQATFYPDIIIIHVLITITSAISFKEVNSITLDSFKDSNTSCNDCNALFVGLGNLIDKTLYDFFYPGCLYGKDTNKKYQCNCRTNDVLCEILCADYCAKNMTSEAISEIENDMGSNVHTPDPVRICQILARCPNTTTGEANITSVLYHPEKSLLFTIYITVTSQLGTAQIAIGKKDTTYDQTLLVNIPKGDYQVTVSVDSLFYENNILPVIYMQDENNNSFKGGSVGEYWSAIGVTASTYEQAQEFVKELEMRQRDGLIADSTVFIAVPDPPLNHLYTSYSHRHTKIGSGTSSLNALFVIVEQLSVASGKTYLDGDVLRGKKVLLLNIGGLHHHMPQVNLCTKSFTMVPLANCDLTYVRSRDSDTDSAQQSCSSNNKTEHLSAVCPIDILLSNLNKVVPICGPGLVIASTESLLLFDNDNPLLTKVESWNSSGVTLLTLPIRRHDATRHGVCKFIRDGDDYLISDIGYRLTEEELLEQGYIDKATDTAQVYTGLIRMCEKTAEKFLYLHSQPPMDSCTYLGVDNGAILFKFGWLPDVLMPMTTGITWEKYHVLKEPQHDNSRYLTEAARKSLWKTFHGTSLRALPLKGKYCYLRHSRDFLEFINYQNEIPISRFAHSFSDNKNKIEATVINSILHGDGYAEKSSIIYSSSLSGNWRIGKDTIVLGVREFSYGFHFGDRMSISEIRLKTNKKLNVSTGGTELEQRAKVLVIIGIDDDIDLMVDDPKATIANRSWSEFFSKSGVTPDEIWPAKFPRMLRTARLFPILTGQVDELLESALWMQDNTSPSLSVIGRWRSSKRLSIADVTGETDLYQIVPCENNSGNPTFIPNSGMKKFIEGDVNAAFQWNRDLNFMIDVHHVEKAIMAGENFCILPYFRKWANTKDLPITKILATLDRLAISVPIHYIGRMLSAISDFLAISVRGRGGLRSGPARNAAWEPALQYFVKKDERKGIIALAKEREKWLNSPEKIIRAARHYEGAGQVFIKNIVDTCHVQLKRHPDGPVKVDQWCTVTLPARIDLAGGWTDTPPICYEHGGLVVNVSITVDQKRPIVVRAKRVGTPHIKLHVDSMDSDAIVCTSFMDLSDYSRPQAPAALLKACFLQLGLVDPHINKTLAEQLESIGGGIEVVSASNLPTGSGLGTSSILAAGLLCAMARVYGQHYDDTSLIHAVLRVEQMLTTGGGWQDQVGGIIGGFKEAKCLKRNENVNINVEHRVLNISRENIEKINNHLLLIYTGRTRLARDLLQDVIRRWYAKTEEIIRVTDSLVATAESMVKALENVDIPQLGSLLREYWEQKKCMASGAEPTQVAQLAKLISEESYGYSLVGAGGGGFMVAITKENSSITREKLKTLIAGNDQFSSVSFHTAEIDLKGLEITFE
ncbi:L-fucose kinase [Heterostelium album PN500]|uniref:L-fucose kinase n=1 Tax=Heterostelium pallidum (strain ATCC 26659 / Pp 5 / PN500) TaxID=670386 RepID=D3BV41_HETP5|nr:L-fucose kinase [Heterostelium album PN500]EFA74979.1 L-fucose kinase [Heterostelium album PN500]|eukprot:XP_020427113.1 L-fucose kinase [Heterostelium album PN500]